MPQQARALNDDDRISSLKTDAAALHDYVMLPMQISIAKNILASRLVAARYFRGFATRPLPAAAEFRSAYGNDADDQWRTEIL
jgi:hypothetical protein